jgi:hypothetical protein
MSDPSEVKLGVPSLVLRDAGVVPGVEDDDENDADYDDEDEPSSASAERWFSPSGFGSPEWWSRI